jgi:hypothetical protein
MTSSRDSWFTQSLLFLVKCVAFVLIFGMLWTFVFRPLGSYVYSSGGDSAQSQDREQEALMKKYWDQAAQSEKLQAEYTRQSAISDEQQSRMNKILEKQEQLFARFERIIERWEAQQGSKK